MRGRNGYSRYVAVRIPDEFLRLRAGSEVERGFVCRRPAETLCAPNGNDFVFRVSIEKTTPKHYEYLHAILQKSHRRICALVGVR